MSFTTLASAALFLNQDEAALTAMETVQLSAMILAIDGVINNYCGWNMLATGYVDKRYSGNGTNSIDLRLYPVNTLTRVRVRAADGTFTEVTTDLEILDDGEIQFLPTSAVVTSFAAGSYNLFVSFNAGFTPDTLPSEITWAANYLVSINYSKITTNTIGIKAQKNQAEDIDFTSIELPVLVERVLNRYRLVSIF